MQPEQPEQPASALDGLAEAIRFLTIIPIPFWRSHPQGMARSFPFFPLAGLVLGTLLALAYALGRALWSDMVGAVLAVALWAILTSGLHLDGLSDTFDAVMSWRSRERKLEIMRDSRIGAMGAIALVSVMLLKLAFLVAAGGHAWAALLVAPAFGRWAMVYAMVRFPLARKDGLGRSVQQHVRMLHVALAGVVALAAALLLGGPAGLLALALGLPAAHLLARWWTNDLGGLTGDTYGALCELSEVVVLATMSLAIW
ncbi:adenosylcobinamide-GDP ribazoletransferase [Chloroflexia bacterium SDU3-3]|nr:adenosylcobinamide-GDP ribazoletransferase [Chloroflexia bacterium SDU3-3]